MAEKEAAMKGNGMAPTGAKERYVILDALRGLAILGICLANYPEFSLYSFLPAEAAAEMPSAGIDRVLQWLLYIFVDCKFYTLFSLLFGIGFSIIISNAERRGANGMAIFYRRMLVLAVIGALHLMLIWSGDILLLYALLGMLLPLFRKVSDRALLTAAGVFLLLPVAVDAVTSILGIDLSAPAVRQQWRWCGRFGITEDNFAYWLRDATTYGQMFRFLVQGACERMYEFISGNRYFKVLGLFLIGLWIGRNRLFADLERTRPLLRRTALCGFLVGLPLSVLYAWSAMTGRPWGKVAHTVFYTVSVYPLGLAYLSGLCLLFLRRRQARVWTVLASPGRMALSNYIAQSVIGVLLFYGIGLGLGAGIGLWLTEIIALVVYIFETIFSRLWISRFRFGPLEWIWRMLTYGHTLPLSNAE